ncbi:hypothetical protein Slin15195_G076910 [Septoria linicola]|uniref:Uncharacterized protein n=1 Tax=Septoria linicola TaxID=215465 RepID=A0A9Q9AYU0_9PEZI|nr:hypothetical protein Slin14017_G038080 [Septoria linicola]USW54372.1 hypothetical protein Slin15195_G076910 [Septoria linicola]
MRQTKLYNLQGQPQHWLPYYPRRKLYQVLDYEGEFLAQHGPGQAE